MKYVFYLFVVISLLGARGCPSGRAPSATARLVVESTSVRDTFPSATSAAAKAEEQVAIARVVGHAQDPQFQAEVAKALGVSPQTVGRAVVQGVGESRLVEVRANLDDRELAVKVANAVADRLAEDFRNNPDVKVRVVDHARPSQPAKEKK